MIQHQQKGKTSSVHDNVVEASQESRSCYVIDTNVLLYDWRALFAFPHATIMVPITVLEELDSFKVETSERGRNARRAIRIFDEAREMGSLVNGVNLKGPEGTPVKIQVIFNEQVDKFSTENSNDNKIIAAVGSIHESGKPVTFISKDLNARVKTNVLGFKVQDYVSQNVNVDRVYKGWADFELPPAEVKTATPEMVAEMMQKKHPWQNQFVHLKADYDRPYSRLFRRIGEKFVEVTYEESLWSFYPKNVQQLMALDLLMDDKIKLVSLLGPAGTGKTFVTLLAALHKVMKESVYRKLLVARPVVALGSDSG